MVEYFKSEFVDYEDILLLDLVHLLGVRATSP